MTKVSNNIRIYGGDGSGVWLAPKGTTLPTALDAALPAAWVELGWFSDDGIEIQRDPSKSEYTAYQAATVVRETITSTKNTFGFTAWEENPATVKAYYGIADADITSTATLATIKVPGGAKITEYSAVVKGYDDDGITRWVTAARVGVSPSGSTKQSQEIYGYAMEATIYDDFTILTNSPGLLAVAAG